MPDCCIVVIGASAGGVESITKLVHELPKNLPAALFVVLHVPASGHSILPSILSRFGTLPALHPRDGEPIRPGHIYVAPPNHHLLVQRDRLRLSLGPCENGHRPAIDALFRSAAQAYGKRVVGIVLSGVLDDGTAGLAIIKARGGTAIVQNPEEALFNRMPRSAIENVEVDHILGVTEIAAFLQLSEQGNDVERALWSATRALEEKAALARRMSVMAREQNRLLSQAQFDRRAEEAERHAALLRQVIMQQSQDKTPSIES